MARRQRGKVVRGRRPLGKRRAKASGKGPAELVTYLARGLVEEPGGVQVAEVKRPDACVFELRVALGDLGKVIGKNGRTAHAIRTLLSLTPAAGEQELILDILD